MMAPLEEVLQNYTDACEAFLDCVVVLEKISGAETVDEAKRLAAEHLRATQRIRSAFVGDAQEPTGGTIRAANVSDKLDAATVEKKTTEIAKAHGCDRGTFTVCWAEHERGAICQCKQEAIRSLIPNSANEIHSSDGGGENRRPATTGNKSGAAPEAEQSSSATSFVRAATQR